MPKRDFPAEHQHRSRLGFYALHENSIEINSSFYKLPLVRTIARWVSEVQPGFRFTFKLWNELTHQKHLLFRPEAIISFMKAIEPAMEHRGCLLVQFPPSLQMSAFPQLQFLLPSLAESGWPLAVEFRHASWYQDPVYEFLNRHGAAMVIQDMPRSAAPLELTSDKLVYLRFHGPKGNYKGSYGDAFLHEYAQYIQEWQAEGLTVYVYFNNTAGAALANLHSLKRFLAEL